MITLKNISKRYGDKVIYDNFNLSISENKVTAILGESGSGKTTLLNILAKLTAFDGEVLGDYKDVSYIFQTDRLIPNLTVLQNLKLVNKGADVTYYLNKMGLSGTENMYPKELSAGMARRVSILRGFIFPSKLMLMDEPFRNLDYAIKYKIIELFKSLRKEDDKTTVFVTHDIKEAVTMADRIVVIKDGKILKDYAKVNDNLEEELFDLLISEE